MKTFFHEYKGINQPDRLILTIYLSIEQISISLYDPDKNGSYCYKDLTTEDHIDIFSAFKEQFFDNAFISLPFRKVLIMYRSPFFTYVPTSMYSDSLQKDFMKFLFPDQQGKILSHPVASSDIMVLYQMPETVYDFFIRSFAKPDFIHYSAPMISFFLEKLKDDASRMIVNIQETGLDIFCFSKDNFLMGNYFPCKTPSEMAYFILFTWRQLQFNQMNDSLHISGNANLKVEIIDLISTYINKIYYLPVFPEIHFEGVETGNIPFELTALSSCAL